MLNLAIMDAMKREDKINNRTNENDFYSPQDQLKIINDIVKKYRIDTENNSSKENDVSLLNSFLKMDEKAFYTFKNDSNIDRTLIRKNFKEKRKSKFQQLVEHVIESVKLDKKNQATMRRLYKELCELKLTNKNQYTYDFKNYMAIKKQITEEFVTPQ